MLPVCSNSYFFPSLLQDFQTCKLRTTESSHRWQCTFILFPVSQSVLINLARTGHAVRSHDEHCVTEAIKSPLQLQHVEIISK